MLDFIIVGQGLAGSILALQLINEGKSFIIIDNQSSSCSLIAAGIVNPITGRKYVKSWNYDKLSDYALGFYNKWQIKFDDEFYIPLKIGKVISSVKDKNDFFLKIEDNHFNKNLIKPLPNHIKYNKNDIYILNGFRLNTLKFINNCKDYFTRVNTFLSDEFKYENILINDKNVVYKNIKSRHIVFCEGYKVKNNPFFNYLPMRPTKGELIELKTINHDINFCIQKNQFLLPTGKNSFKLGSNYDRDNINEIPTEKTKDNLLDFFHNTTTIDYLINDHRAGIRPSTIDRRPFIGAHPIHKNLWIFNGFGSKGVSLCPYYSSQLTSHIFKNESLCDDINIIRYNKYFSNTQNS